MKRRIAIWIHGGVGGGNFSQGQPVINKIIEHLKIDFEVIIYSQLRPNPEYVAQGFTVQTAPKGITVMGLRWLYLTVLFAYNHILKPHQLLYAFWGYPAGLIAVFLGKTFKKPSVIHLQGGDSARIPELQYGAFYGWFSRKLSCWAYNTATILIALTEFQKGILQQHGIKRKVEIIPYGPDLGMFKFNRNKFKHKVIRFIHIGNHTLIKDQFTLLKTFKIINSTIASSLIVIGHDALNGNLKKYAIELGIERDVEFIDPVPYAKIPDYFNEADVILHTSLYEGQATVISEAAACGTLLAGTRVGLLSDLGDDYGLIVDIKDASALAKKVLSTLNNSDLFMAYINRSRKWAEQFDHQWTLNTISILIKDSMYVK